MKYIFYNTVTGEIYSVKKMDHRQAEYQCGKNAQFNMSCVPEMQVGVVLDKTKQKIDLDTMTLVHKEQPIFVTVPNQIRQKRNNLLKSTDWTQVPDGPLTDAKKAEYQTYRTALRAINPDDYASIDDVIWPTQP